MEACKIVHSTVEPRPWNSQNRREISLIHPEDSAEVKGFLSHFKLGPLPTAQLNQYFNYEHTPETFVALLRKALIVQLRHLESRSLTLPEDGTSEETSRVVADSVTITGVLVESVPEHWTLRTLQENFAPYGTLESVRTVRNGTAAFVNYQSMQEARTAAAMMAGYVELDDYNNPTHEPLKLRATFTKVGDVPALLPSNASEQAVTQKSGFKNTK